MPRKVNKTTPKKSMLTNQRTKVKATKLEAGPATVKGGQTPGAGRSTMQRTSSRMQQAVSRGKAEVAKAQTRRNAKAASQRMAGKLAKAGAMRALGTAGKLAGRAATFYQGIKANNTATGTLSEAKKKYGAKAMPQKQGPAAPATTQASFNKKTFDQAFSSARKSGAKTFTWRGKKYTTKMK